MAGSLGSLAALLLLLAVAPYIVVRAEDDGGMCTMETKSTCADDAKDGETADSEETSPDQTGDSAEAAGDLPMSTMSDRPPGTPDAAAEDDGGMCTMETKSTCADDAKDGETADSEETSPGQTNDSAEAAGDLPMSTMSDRPPGTPDATAEDHSGMCTMETKSTCGGDEEDSADSSAEGSPDTTRYSEAANSPAGDAESATPVSAASSDPEAKAAEGPKEDLPYWHGQTAMHLACVICGDRVPEALVMMKSGLVFSSSPLKFHIFTEDDLRKDLSETLDAWQDVKDSRVSYKFYPIKYPLGVDAKVWRATFQPCATMRLFIPMLAKDVDALVYLDTDTLFLTPVEKLWKHFSKFDNTQLTALTPESEDLVNGWYPRFAKHPFYGKAGLNSGVMMMNLTRMRSVRYKGKSWSKELINIFEEYQQKISWGDQCILNIYFSRHPELVYDYPCDWNYRPDHCMYGVNNCHLSNSKAAKILHGNRRAFHDIPRMPMYTAIYEEFAALPAVGGVDAEALTKRMQERFSKIKKDHCLIVSKFLMAGIRQTARSVKSRHERLTKKN